jgi:(1->4)-alpha-D-glucan 1-alpha-D-glucosylmutase
MNLVRELLADWQDGRIKMFITYKALNFRRDRREIFDDGDYIPMEATAPVTENVCAFARRSGRRNVIVAAPRLMTGLAPRDALPLCGDIWGKSSVVVPFAEEGRRYRNIFTGEELTTVKQNEAVVLPLAGIFCNTPVALLEMLL